jgi:hypothetical protein
MVLMRSGTKATTLARASKRAIAKSRVNAFPDAETAAARIEDLAGRLQDGILNTGLTAAELQQIPLDAPVAPS